MSTENHTMGNSVLLWLAAALGLALGAAAWAQHEHHHDAVAVDVDSEVGDVQFDADCQPAQRSELDRALALMHHMMYVQARASFAEIKSADPDCAMAWWGVATSLFQPLWGTRPDAAELERGRSAIERAGGAVNNAREAALIKATAGFFDGPDDRAFRERMDAWIEGMATAYREFPDDADVASLHALSLLTQAQWAEAAERDRLLDRAEVILRDVWRERPQHPGAIHYSIHATDVDGRAENALDMVESYGRIAPHTAHALHMPSHIYVRLGDWEQVIDWNVRSADAALDQPANGAVSHHYVHAIDYLIYAYLQQGRDRLAERVYRETLAKGPHQASFVSAFHFAAMPARLALEQRDWSRAAALAVRDPDYLPWDQSQWAEAMSWFAIGMGRLKIGQLDEAEQALTRLSRLSDEAEALGETTMARFIEVDRLILAGWFAQLSGQPKAGESLLRQAVDLEASVEKHPVTPGALYPPREALGDLLLVQNSPEQALDAYREADEIWPRRHNTYVGALRAALAAGDSEAVLVYPVINPVTFSESESA
ncbi:MAG: hypothetical protein EA370_08540 [Wenzhouxiangella sp.]|nr:MAG: hypothetical protein EA370_08540 [Wenzhouxiangella sp.]